MDLYEIIVNTVDDPISYLDTDYIYRAVNETFTRYAKRPRAEIVGLSVAELLGTEVFEEQVRPHLDRCLGGEEVHYQAWFPVPEEEPRYMDVGYYPVREQDGSVTGVVVASRDTTESKKAEEARRESERKFRALFHGLPVPVYTGQRSRDGFVLVDHTDAADEITGGKISNFVGMTVTAMYPDRPDIVQDVSRCFAEKGSIQREMDYRFKTTGKDKTLVVKYAFVPPDLVLVHTEDVTERVRAQEEAAYERDLMRTLLENIPDYVYFKDKDRRFVRVSNSFCDLFHRSLEEIIGKRDEDLFPPEVVAETVSDDLRVIETGKPLIDREEGGESIGGEEHWVLTTKLPWYDTDGNIIGLFGISREITKRKRAEETLRVSQERYEMATQAASVGVWDWNIQTGEFYLDPNVKAILGYSDEEIPNDIEVWTTYVHPEDRQPVMEAAQAHLDGRTPEYVFEHRMLHKDGSVRWIFVRGVAVRDAQGQAIRLVGSDTDITERKRVGQALQGSERKFKALYQSMPVPVYTWQRSGEDFCLIDYNGAADAITHGRMSDFLGTTARAMYPDRPDIVEDMSRCFAEKISIQKEMVYQFKSLGEDKTLVVKYAFVPPDLVLVHTEDITERKKAEEALRKSEQEYRNLVEKISDVIYAVDTAGVTTYVSPAIEPFLGFTAEQVVGQPFARFIVPEDLEQSKNSFQVLMSGVSPGPAEYRVLTSSGETRWMRVSSQPIVEEERVTGVQGVLTDITERKRVEEQLQEVAAAAERQRLARELHDAVTQTLFAASLVAETLPTVWDRDPQAARKGLEQLRSWIRGALAELRIMLLELRPDDLPGKPLDELIRQLGDGLMARTQTSVTTTVVGNCSLPTEVKLALYRIAQEALNNVGKHAQASQVRVCLSCEPGHVTLEISDDGWGFNPDQIESGQLGVGIMHERAKAINSELTLVSQVGKGTTVTVIWQDASGPEQPALGPGLGPRVSRKRGQQ